MPAVRIRKVVLPCGITDYASLHVWNQLPEEPWSVDGAATSKNILSHTFLTLY